MNTVLLAIILIPLVEIYLFIKIGSQIGALNTILLIFATAIIGVFYARHEGLNTLKSGLSQLYKNQMPLFELMSGAALAVAAFLLILPGFATDVLGFLIIFPLTRKIIFHLFTKNKKEKFQDYLHNIEDRAEEKKPKNVYTLKELLKVKKFFNTFLVYPSDKQLLKWNKLHFPSYIHEDYPLTECRNTSHTGTIRMFIVLSNPMISVGMKLLDAWA